MTNNFDINEFGGLLYRLKDAETDLKKSEKTLENVRSEITAIFGLQLDEALSTQLQGYVTETVGARNAYKDAAKALLGYVHDSYIELELAFKSDFTSLNRAVTPRLRLVSKQEGPLTWLFGILMSTEDRLENLVTQEALYETLGDSDRTATYIGVAHPSGDRNIGIGRDRDSLVFSYGNSRMGITPELAGTVKSAIEETLKAKSNVKLSLKYERE